jgi:hypothetical protein
LIVGHVPEQQIIFNGLFQVFLEKIRQKIFTVLDDQIKQRGGEKKFIFPRLFENNLRENCRRDIFAGFRIGYLNLSSLADGIGYIIKRNVNTFCRIIKPAVRVFFKMKGVIVNVSFIFE